MDYKEKYLSWTENIYIDNADKLDLKNIFDDDKEIKERFYKDLEFGTGGLRGIIGIGTNRINKYVIRKISQGLADFINKRQVKNKSVAIAYDSRLYSQEFAKETALVLNANGIKSYLFDELHPTPVLSFAVRYLNCCAGVVITASHNPKEYNGYKVYGEDGGQVVSPVDKEIVDCVNKITDFNQIKLMSEDEALEKGLLNLIGKEIDDEYIKKIKEQRINLDLKHDLKIVYTPLNGAGNKLVQRILKESGFENVYVVKEQESPDPSFKTIGIPNPENPKAFDLALKLAKEKNADIILATDPDSDRIGVAVKNKNDEYKFLTGNMTGVLLLEYILSQKKKLSKMPVNPVIISTIVSSRMAKLIALDYHAEYIDVLTGFKYIAQEIKKFEKDKNFVFGFEESYGCLIGTHARDKDAVIAAMLICEMADYYKEKNLNLLVA
ncbi:MAG: phospho-sugar mutase, partial [Firmicutes bacterium]|nr:phospho-sugar mutase [Bacillota bacterium]